MAACCHAGEREMPVALCKKGDSGPIRHILGEDEVCRHLKNLGFVEGTDVKVVSRLCGSMIVEVRGSRIALDKTMAERIIIG